MVTVPALHEFTADPEQKRYWVAVGLVIDYARRDLGDDMGFSIFLSRLTRELRMTIGMAATAQLLHEFADKQPEAAFYDEFGEPPRGNA